MRRLQRGSLGFPGPRTRGSCGAALGRRTLVASIIIATTLVGGCSSGTTAYAQKILPGAKAVADAWHAYKSPDDDSIAFSDRFNAERTVQRAAQTLQLELRALTPPDGARLVHEQLVAVADRLAVFADVFREAINERLRDRSLAGSARDDAEVLAIVDYVDRILPNAMATLEEMAGQ